MELSPQFFDEFLYLRMHVKLYFLLSPKSIDIYATFIAL